MDALTENALATMPGPQFLGFYVFLAASAVFALIFVGASDEGGGAPALPGRPDPYQFAFLRDGYGGVVWLAIFALKRAGFVEMSEKGELRPARADGPPPRDPCERAVLGAIGHGRSARSLAAGMQASATLGDAFAPRLRAMEAQGLVRSSALRARVRSLAIGLGVAMTVLALYKLSAAQAHGRHNVGFLILSWLATLGALLIAALKFGAAKPTTAGRRMLDRAVIAYGAPSRPQAAAPSFGLDPVLMLSVATLGFTVLEGGPDSAFAQQMRRNNNSGSCGGGGSCSSSGGCGGGGGCGGCGGS